jgi:hypothetical protein
VIAVLHGHMHRPAIYRWENRDVYHPPHIRGNPTRGEPVTHGFFVFRVAPDELSVAERRLDGTWGMTTRTSLAAPAPAGGGSARD